MLLVQLRFQCDRCPAYTERWVRLGPRFYLAGDQLPDGWSIEQIDEHNIRLNCPLHKGDLKL